MAATTGGTRFALADDVVLQAAGEELLLVKLTAEDMFALNHTAADVVRRLTAGVPFAVLLDELVAAYETDRTDLERDVTSLLDALIARGLLEVVHEQR